MATKWFTSNYIVQYSEPSGEEVHVMWDDSDDFANLKSVYETSVGTVGNLVHIARAPKPDITNKTYFLKLTDFRFTNLPDIISGIQLQLSCKRVGRVTDDTISLTYNDTLIGNNQATLDLSPVKFYGSEVSLWGLKTLLTDTVLDSSFGIVLRFKSHPSWPHKDPIDLVSVQLRIY